MISAARLLRVAAMVAVFLPLLALGGPASLHRDVLVFIPAYEATELYDPDLGDSSTAGATHIWVDLETYFSRTVYFALRNPNPLLSRPMLSVGPIDIYRGFVEALTKPRADRPGFAPYTQGSDFFTFSYDWRQEIATVSAPQFARAIESYAWIHAVKTGVPESQTRFIIVTHSMGGLVARTWLSENPTWAARVSGLYLVGSPNRGSVKAIKTVVYGPDSLKSVAHGFPGVLLNLLPTDVDQDVTKLTGISRPSLYELLPMDDPHWTNVGADGSRRPIAASGLRDAKTWEPFWPSAELEKRLFIDDWLRKRLAEGRKKIVPAEWEFCQDPAFGHLKELLRQTAAFRARQGTLQETASLLTASGRRTRLRIIFSTGLETPSGLVTHGEHDATEALYTYEKGPDGDGTMEAANVLDGFAASAPNVKTLPRVPHGRLMIDEGFLSYFLAELSGQPMVPAVKSEKNPRK